MSGGDLDGDVYLSIWDKSIVDELSPEMIKKPANYKKYPEDKILQSDKIEDHIKRYFEKDNLGHLSDLHLGLCDQIGKDWDKNPEYKEDLHNLSWLISIAVDFAKHGKCVEKEKYKHIESKLKRWPDFMEKHTQSKEIVESKEILG